MIFKNIVDTFLLLFIYIYIYLLESAACGVSHSIIIHSCVSEAAHILCGHDALHGKLARPLVDFVASFSFQRVKAEDMCRSIHILALLSGSNVLGFA